MSEAGYFSAGNGLQTELLRNESIEIEYPLIIDSSEQFLSHGTALALATGHEKNHTSYSKSG
jgi:hypothetical protein